MTTDSQNDHGFRYLRKDKVRRFVRQVGCSERLKPPVVSRFGLVIVKELPLTRSIFWLQLLLEGLSPEHGIQTYALED